MVDFGCPRRIEKTFNPYSSKAEIRIEICIYESNNHECFHATGVHNLINCLKNWFLQFLPCPNFHQKGYFKEVGILNWQSNPEQYFSSLFCRLWVKNDYQGANAGVLGILESSATHWYKEITPTLQMFFASSHLYSLSRTILTLLTHKSGIYLSLIQHLPVYSYSQMSCQVLSMISLEVNRIKNAIHIEKDAPDTRLLHSSERRGSFSYQQATHPSNVPNKVASSSNDRRECGRLNRNSAPLYVSSAFRHTAAYIQSIPCPLPLLFLSFFL
jgi:hypothetical protein